MSEQLIDLSKFDSIIFDLGGVILPLAPQRTLNAFAELLEGDTSNLYQLRKQHSLFDAFERGEITAADFRSALIQLTKTETPPPAGEFDRAWNAMLGVIPDTHLVLLRRLQEKKRTFLLSNTNEIHIAQFLAHFEERHARAHGDWSSLFEAVHYSHDLKMRKPEPRIFQELLKRHRLDPSRTIFLDDNVDNINAANREGIVAVHHPLNASLMERFQES